MITTHRGLELAEQEAEADDRLEQVLTGVAYLILVVAAVFLVWVGFQTVQLVTAG